MGGRGVVDGLRKSFAPLHRHFRPMADAMMAENETPAGPLTANFSSAWCNVSILERAMITGIHRIAKESIFSELNNLDVCTVIDQKYNRLNRQD